MLKVISAFILALPELIKLISNLQKEIDKAKLEKKVTDDIKKINQAFKDRDADLLNNIFNS